MAAFTLNVTMDCVDIDEMTRFWSAALGTGHGGPGGQRVLRVPALTGRTPVRGLRQCCL